MVRLPSFGNFVIRFVFFVLGVAIGGVQLYYWKDLRACRSRARVMSLGVNFAGFIIALFLTFRQLTCVNVCKASRQPWDGDRLSM